MKYFYETSEYLIYTNGGDYGYVYVTKFDKYFNLISMYITYKYCY